MSTYFAHAMPTYGLREEKQQLERILAFFAGDQIVNPADYSNDPEKKKDTMGFCFGLIDRCQNLVFTKWRGVITSGVGQEVNYALKKDMQVFELVNASFSRVTAPVDHQTREETRRAYFDEWFSP